MIGLVCRCTSNLKAATIKFMHIKKLSENNNNAQKNNTNDQVQNQFFLHGLHSGCFEVRGLYFNCFNFTGKTGKFNVP